MAVSINTKSGLKLFAGKGIISLLLSGFVVYFLAGIAYEAKVENYQKMVKKGALKAAQELPLSNASIVNIRLALGKQQNCKYFVVQKRSFKEAGSTGTALTAIASSGTELYFEISGTWSLFSFLFSDLYAKPFQVGASAFLRGAGKIDINGSEKPFTLPEFSTGSTVTANICNTQGVYL